MAGVELKNLSKTFPGGVNAVAGADLVIADGEFLVLVGPSGCGKSTTLRMIAGLESVTAGEILIGGRIVNAVEPKDRDIAMVFQNYALYPHMTVYKNMAFGLTMRRTPKAEVDRRVRDAARILDIENLLDRKPKALSGGQRQRVAVGRAIVRDPKVFLFDEPLSNLDAMLRVQMRAELRKLHARLKTTMIYVTHDQVEAMTMGDRIVVMSDGAIQQVAPPAELYRSPANRFVAGFIGSPPMNFIPGAIREEGGKLTFRDRGENLRLDVDDRHRAALSPRTEQHVLLGIRPEHVVDCPGQIAVPGASVPTRIELVEPLGAETHVHAMIGDQSVVARVEGSVSIAADSDRLLNLLMAEAHFFEPESGTAIA